MAQTLQNQLLLAKSMNGIITFDDGAGTTISNGIIDTDSLVVDNLTTDNFTTNNMIVNYMTILRDSNPVVNAALGSTVDIGLLVQNMIFDDISRLYQIWDDTATYKLFEVDVLNKTIIINNSTISFPNSNVSFNSNLPTSIITTTTGGTQFITRDIADGRYGELATANVWTSTNAFDTNLPTSTATPSADNQLITRIYADGRYGEIATANVWTSTNAFDTNLPTSIITTTTGGTQFITRAIGDGRFGQLAATNTWSSTNAFNTNLPTSTITTTTGGTQFITRDIADGRYGEIATANVWTSTNAFDTNLPTSTISTTTGGTQFITRAIGDGRFGQLAAANTWTETNQFNKGILPCTTWSQTNIQVGGLNTMGNRQTSSLNNVGVGVDTLKGDANPAGYQYSTGSRNTAIGNYALMQQGSGDDNVAIGYQAMQVTGLERTSAAGITPFRCVAIGAGSQKNNVYGSDNISIGYNCLNNVGSGTRNIAIGSNTGNGLGNVGDNIVIGSNAMPSAVDNGIVCIGAGAMQFATGSANRGVFIGGEAGRFNQSGSLNTFIGNNAGVNNTSGSQNVCLGTFAGRLSLSTGIYMTCIGYDSSCTQSNEFSIGADSYTERAELTLPNKNRINCCQFTGSASPYSINWRSNEYVIINSATTTQLILPQAIDATAKHVGACFHICRTNLSTSNLVISATGTEKITYKGSLVSSITIDSWVMSISFVCVDYVAGNGVWSAFTYNDRVSLATDANRIQTLTDSTNVNYPLCFTILSNGTNYNNVYGKSNLTYNPNTSLLTVPNLTVSNKINIQKSSLYNTAIVTLDFGSALSENIIIQSSTVTDINLPSPTDANIGCSFTITRAYVPNSAISINAQSSDKITSADSNDGPELTNWFMDSSIGSVKITLTKIGLLYYWILSYSRSMKILANTTSNINYPVLFGSLGSNISQVFADSTNINYNPSTDTLNITNVSATTVNPTTVNATTINATTINATNVATTKPILEKQNPTVTVSTSSNINVDPTAGEYSLYKFCNMGTGIITYRLPIITASTVGWRFMIKRFWGSNFNVCSFNPSAFKLQSVFFDSVGSAGTTSFTMSTSQSMFELVSTITQVGGFTGTFSNVAGSNIITINTITAGNIVVVGGILNLNGNIRTITGFSTGRGQVGNYSMDSNIPTANGGATFTSTESYGFILTNFN